MRKDFAKKEFKEKQASTSDAKSAFFFSVAIIIICTASFFIYQYKHHHSYFSFKNLPALSQIKSWFRKGKGELGQGLATVKNLAANKNNTEQEIHFEFYNVLPTMQVSVSQPTDQDSRRIPMTAEDNQEKALTSASPVKTLTSSAH